MPPLVLDGSAGISGVDGTASNPAIEGTDSNTGIFYPAADTVAIGTGGTEALRVNSSQNVGIGTSSPTARLTVVTGAAGNNEGEIRLSENATYYAGLRRVNATDEFRIGSYGASQNITFYTVSSERMRLDASGNLGIGTSSPATRLHVQGNEGDDAIIGSGSVAFKFGVGHTGNGTGYINLYPTSSPTSSPTSLAFQMGGTERARITSGGDFCIGDTAVSAAAERLVVKSAGATSATAGIKIINSSGTELFFVRSDGAFRTGSAAVSPYNNTTATAANVWINTDGTLLRSTSSLKYKTNVNDATHGLSDVLKLRSVTYKSKNTVDGEQVFGGLIAEEVHEAGLTEFVQYAEDGTPDALSYGNMVSLCIKAIQELNAKIEAQAAEIAALKGNA